MSSFAPVTTASPRLRFSGERLRSLRQRRGYTQSELARRAGLREKVVILAEGEKHVPRADTVAAFAGALECEVSQLFVADDEQSSGDESEDDRVARVRALAAELSIQGRHALSADLLAMLIDSKERSGA